MPYAILIDEETRQAIVDRLPFDASDIFDTATYNYMEYYADSYLVIDGSVDEGNFVANVFIAPDFVRAWKYTSEILDEFVEISPR